MRSAIVIAVLLVVVSVAFAQSGSGTDNTMRLGTGEPRQLPDGAEPELAPAGQKTTLPVLIAGLDKKKVQKQSVKAQMDMEVATARRTGSDRDWAKARRSAERLDKLNIEIASLEARYRDTEDYLHRENGYFLELQHAGFITRGQADELYAPKTPAVAPASPVPPAAPGKTNTTPAQTPAKENDMLQGILIGIAAVALIYGIVWLCRRAGLATLASIVIGVCKKDFITKYDDVEFKGGNGVFSIKGKKNP